MTATRPPYTELVGEHIRLEPMRRDHLPALFTAIGHPRVFAAGYGGGPAAYRDTVAGFLEWAETYYDWGNGNVFAVVVQAGAHEGEVVGTTTMSDFVLPNESAHIGWTAYDPRVWGSAVNPEAKRMLLGSAFENGFGRVKIQADAVNERSRAAIAGIGATFEGVQRRDLPRADGTFRDSAIFSVIIDDWPRVRALLDDRIARHSGRPLEFRSVENP